ncbi:MAG: hypothetical protein ACFFC0_05300, partial [Promethearchaeota archaeon]
SRLSLLHHYERYSGIVEYSSTTPRRPSVFSGRLLRNIDGPACPSQARVKAELLSCLVTS